MKHRLSAVWLFICFLWMSSALAEHSLIVDTDMNTDDAIALLYLLNNKDIDIKAITVEANVSVHCEPALKNIAGLLALTQHKPIPIACGGEQALHGGHRFPNTMFHETDTLSDTAMLLPKKIIYPNHHAIQLLEQVLQQTKKPLDIVALGPQTNLALLLKKAPYLKNKIHRVYIMGGAIHIPGNLNDIDTNNKNHLAEWNIYFDPLAASIVFRSGVPIYLVPIDVTEKFPIDNDFFEKLKAQRGTPVADYFYEIVNKSQPMLTNGKWFFWDPLAAVIAVHPEFAIFHQEKISILQVPEEKSGALVINSAHGSTIHVCNLVERKQFENELLKIQ